MRLALVVREQYRTSQVSSGQILGTRFIKFLFVSPIGTSRFERPTVASLTPSQASLANRRICRLHEISSESSGLRTGGTERPGTVGSCIQHTRNSSLSGGRFCRTHTKAGTAACFLVWCARPEAYYETLDGKSCARAGVRTYVHSAGAFLGGS